MKLGYVTSLQFLFLFYFQGNSSLYSDLQFESAVNEVPECSSSRHPPRSSEEDEPKDIDLQICFVLSLQSKAVFHRIEGGLISLLRNCLERENSTTSIISGYVDHFQSTWKEDMGWGCGWRNIQMLSSHVLRETPEARDVMFGGSGFVPDIGSLQRWLEIAWQRGFDVVGSLHFEGKVYGSRKWIGTTECAALLRSFGLRAKIVDFDGNGGKRNVGRVYGPMDKFVVRRDINTDESVANPSDGSLQNSKGYQVLIDWVWNYFCKDKPKESGKQNVVVTNKMPLYFQHQGHSRTIVGIQVKHQKNGTKQYNLLVLDPGHRTEALEKSLRENSGWQKFLKRGLHTLRKPQYQLCYVDPGIAHGEEVEQLKTLQSVYFQW
ncbi:hypothetical protein RND81_05G048500 [Saponaria officinalis]|uniref:UFSP1/2/DUB catalytic domain-containing protein n=1 Tax=Saponaria officinalis TaxID=3572 RepID=A0AAW1KU78_SAPOF